MILKTLTELTRPVSDWKGIKRRSRPESILGKTSTQANKVLELDFPNKRNQLFLSMNFFQTFNQLQEQDLPPSQSNFKNDSSSTTVMKTCTIVIQAMVLATGILSAIIDTHAAADGCGNLGVMIDNGTLPEGVDPTQLRKCVDHPLGKPDLTPRGELADTAGTLVKRVCDPGSAKWGCSNGYCWKLCGPPGSGNWCWTARDEGYGDWITCSSSTECSLSFACGQPGGANVPCDACGCKC